MIFLLEYDRSRGELLSIRPYADSDRLLAQNAGLERELQLHRDGIQREVVLLQAESEDALRKTHRHYFEDITELAAAVARE
ncbi:MAG TPA: hypothetical protein VGJ81_06290 [Thermoanaerobaculia bacterium]|jgi:hypothetical protein